MELPLFRRAAPSPSGSGSRVLAALVALVCAAALPVLRDAVGHTPASLTAIVTAIVLCDALVAALLLARFLARGSALPLGLACTYLFAAIVAAARMLVLPGIGDRGDALLAAGRAPDWLWALGHAGLPVGLALSLWGGPPALRRALAAQTLRRPLAAAGACLGAGVASAAAAVAIVLAGDGLPASVAGGAPTAAGAGGAALVLAVDLAVLVVAVRRGRRSDLERRLAVVAGAALAATALTLAGGARFTGAWYAATLLELLGAGIVLVTLLADPADLRLGGPADARAAVRDPLTGAASRAAAIVTAEHLHRTRPPGAALALVLVDVDALRAIADAHGALAADAVLLTVAQRLRAELRDEDVLARAGEEGFLILLPGTDLDGATLVADRAIAAIRDQPVGTWAHDVRTTASGGVAMVGDGADAVARALVAADLALNQAKAHGRDQVVSPARALVVPLRRAGAAPPRS